MLSVPTALTLFAAGLQTPQDGRAALEVLPVPHVSGQNQAIAPPQWSTMLQVVDGPDLLLASNSDRQFPIDGGVEFLRTLFAHDVENDTLHIDAVNDNLVLSGDSTIVGQVRERVKEIADALLRPLEIEATVWEAPAGDAPGGVLDPRELAEFTKNAKALWRARTIARSGRPVLLDGQRWTPYVRDIDVEVAQKATASQPTLASFGEGGRVVVLPHLLVSGDDVVVMTQFGLAQRRGAVRRQPTGVAGQPDLEVPTLETTFGACSGRIRNGGALAITETGDDSSGGRTMLTIRVAARTPPAARTGARFGIFPCGALTCSALTQRVSPPPTRPTEDEPGVEEEEGPGILTPEALQDWIRASLGADAETTFSIHESGHHLFVSGNERTIPMVETLLRGLEERLLQTVSVRTTGSLVPVDADNGPARRLHEIVFPSLHGRMGTVARLLETNTIAGQAAEIAQEATNHNPVVATLQAGTWIRVRTAAVGTGEHLELLGQCMHFVPPQVQQTLPQGGLLGLTATATSRFAHDGAVAKGQAVEHGDGPLVTIDGRTFRTTLATVVSW